MPERGTRYEAQREQINERTERIRFHDGEHSLSWGEVIARWQDDEGFRSCFVASLQQAPWRAFYWETPPVTDATRERLFEQVLVDTPGLATAAPEPTPFREHFARASTQHVVTFSNLGGDATLVVPCPRGDDWAYADIATFARRGPASQLDALWKEVGRALDARLRQTTSPCWVSTAGGGVFWVHVRLDSRPKYYSHAAYRRFDP